MVTAEWARSLALQEAERSLDGLDARIERETLALTTTWLGRRRLRYVERAIWRAARRGERETLVGGWSSRRSSLPAPTRLHDERRFADLGRQVGGAGQMVRLVMSFTWRPRPVVVWVGRWR